MKSEKYKGCSDGCGDWSIRFAILRAWSGENVGDIT